MKAHTVTALACLVAVLLLGCSEGVEGEPQAAREQGTTEGPGRTEPTESIELAPPTTGSGRNPDEIPGIKHIEYEIGQHVLAPDRVAYEESPPFGGAHDGVWAPCNGVVYDRAVRTEHIVHSLEHGAIWIAYDPDKVDQSDVQTLADNVEAQPYTMMSPYPGLDQPISLQAWSYQLKVTEATDERIKQFIMVLRRNPDTTPEPDAPCDLPPDVEFDLDDPPPFDPSPPGKDAEPAN